MAYSQEGEGLQDLRDAIDLLEAASKIPARSRAAKITPTIDEVCEYAYQFGIRAEELWRIVKLVVTKTELDQTSTTTLIKNLCPATRVGSDIVLLVVNCLGQAGRCPAASTQAALVKWLMNIHDVLEDQSSLARLYSVLFNLLDMITIRSLLCQLLAILTQRKHVRPFRIQKLLELLQQTANEPALINLLRVYKNFSPEIVIGVSTTAKIPQSLRPDAEWRQRLLAIQQFNANIDGDHAPSRGFRVARKDRHQTKQVAIPEVHTFRAGETKKTLEEVRNASDFVEHMEDIEPPSQTIAALQDPLLQKYLQLGCSEDAQQRLSFWLKNFFEEELDNIKDGFGLSATLPEILSGVLSYTESAKYLLLVVEQFLTAYLPLWNGYSDMGVLLDLLSYLSPQRFDSLHSRSLTVLENAVLSGAESPYTALLDFYACLAQRWMSFRHSRPPNSSPLAGSTRSDALFSLFTHVATLAESALTTDRSAAAAAAPAILSFYERTADLATAQILEGRQTLPPVLPTQTLMYALLTTPDLSTFSRACALLATYKRAFERQDAGVTRVYQTNATELLNSYLIDTCNMLWRSRALNTSDPNAVGFLCPEPLTAGLQTYLTSIERDYSVHTAFDFAHSTLTAGLASAAFFSLEDKAQAESADEVTRHAGPVTQRSLQVLGKEGGVLLTWKSYRVEMLEWLAGCGVAGVKRLMFATMKDLMR